MKFNILTLFPEQVEEFLNKSIIGNAIKNDIISVNIINIRDFAHGKYKKVDDTMYGGGTGMLMMCEPVFDAYKSLGSFKENHVIYVSPKGETLNQKKVIELSHKEEITIICGHYEGIDARVIDEIVDEEISIGDYVLTGGEIAACVIVDSVSRMIENVLPNEDAFTNESHMNDTLEAPQYTKPAVWHNRQVPYVLKSGDQAKIDEYNELHSLYDTMTKRPDMFDKLEINANKWQKLLEFIRLI